MSLVTIERSNSSDELSESCDTDNDGIDGESADDIFARSRTSSFEGFFASKGAAYAIPDGDFARKASLKGGEIQSHLQGMVNLIRDEDTMRLIVKLESPSNYTHYLTIVTTYGVTDEEESVLLGFDWFDENVTIGLVIPLWNNVELNLDGDGGFKVKTDFAQYLFKPVSVQTMWCALQWIHRCLATARKGNHFIGGMSHTWLAYYKNRISSPWECIKNWEQTDELLNKRDETHELVFDKVKTDEELLKGLIRCKLKEILTRFDLDEITCRQVRDVLESEMNMSLRHLKGYVDEQMLVVVGRMDSSSKITDHIYLGSEWNASNYEELKENGVGYILNITKEIDNFFPGTFEYMNIRVYDLKEEDLLHHWGKTYRFLHSAKERGSAALVHCRRGISRSASTVVAFLMKEYKMSLHDAMKLVKSKRSIVQPNPGFWKQLIIYEGILRSSEHRHSSLFRRRSNSDSRNVKRPHKKAKHSKNPTELDQTDGNSEHAQNHQTTPRVEESSNENEDNLKNENSENSSSFAETSPISESPEHSFSTSSEEDITSSDEESAIGRLKLRRTQSEPVMKTSEQDKPVLRKSRARTFVESRSESAEYTFDIVTSSSRNPDVVDDSRENIFSLDVKEKSETLSENIEDNGDVDKEPDVTMKIGDGDQNKTQEMEVSDPKVVMAEENDQKQTKLFSGTMVTEDIQNISADVELFPNVDKQNNELAPKVELGEESKNGTSEVSITPRRRSIGDKLEEKLLLKHGKLEHCEILKKVEGGRGRVHRRERRSKSDLQLCQSGVVKRNTQIIEEHMLHSILADSEKTLASLTLNAVEDQLQPTLLLSEKDLGENAGQNTKNDPEEIEHVKETSSRNDLRDGTLEISGNTAAVCCKNGKNMIEEGNDNTDVNTEEKTKHEMEQREKVIASDEVISRKQESDDVKNEDICIDPMTCIDLTSHHGDAVKRKSAAFESRLEEQAKIELPYQKHEQPGKSDYSDETIKQQNDLGTNKSEQSDQPEVVTENDVYKTPRQGTGARVPKLDLEEIVGEYENLESPCNIVVDDYSKWESAKVCDRIKILENIIAKTGGSFPSPRSRKLKKNEDCIEKLDEDTSLMSSIDNQSTDEVATNISEFPNDSSSDDKVKSLVDKFGGK